MEKDAQEARFAISEPCTFFIKVVFTDRYTIQGHVKWIEEEKTRSFRSFLELAGLMQEALRDDKSRLKDFRSWDK